MSGFKICAICLLTNLRAAGRCPGPFYYTTNPWKSQAQNRRQHAQTLISRIVQPAGAAGVGRHSPSTRPTQFSAHMLTYRSLLLTPITHYPRRRTISLDPRHNLTLQKIFLSNFCNPREENHNYKKTHFLTYIKFYDII